MTDALANTAPASTASVGTASVGTAPTRIADDQIAEYALRLGDDALITAQRLGEWIANAPELEEDVALGNIGLDELGQARSLLGYAGSLTNRTEDELAYFRDDQQFRCCHLVCLPRGDFADAVARLLVFGSYQLELYSGLVDSADATIAGVAGKAVKEVTYHVEHGAGWVVRLGDGTDTSRNKMIDALDRLWPYVPELFDTAELEQTLAAARIAVDSSTLEQPVLQRVSAALRLAGLELPAAPRVAGGGRQGRPSEHLGFLLAEMQVLARAHPGATW